MAGAATDRARPGDGEGGERAQMTIEQLAAAAGMSVRNIRNHHSRGLLAPPEVRARVGYYDAGHLERLRQILELQAEGFNLAAIERLLGASGESTGRLLGLRNALSAPFEDETPEVLTAEELERRFDALTRRDVERVRKLGLLVPLGDGRFEAPSPALLRAAEDVVALGVPLHAAIVLVERVSRDCESIARAFVRLYLEQVWEPFADAGQPEERWQEVIEAISGLRAIASEALLAVFKQRMSAEVDGASAKLISRQLRRSR